MRVDITLHLFYNNISTGVHRIARDRTVLADDEQQLAQQSDGKVLTGLHRAGGIAREHAVNHGHQRADDFGGFARGENGGVLRVDQMVLRQADHVDVGYRDAKGV